MVRFIILEEAIIELHFKIFTFQYGQIYYCRHVDNNRIIAKIYIPIWLDLLYISFQVFTQYYNKFTFQYGQIYYEQDNTDNEENAENLHSNMVRFIILKSN